MDKGKISDFDKLLWSVANRKAVVLKKGNEGGIEFVYASNMVSDAEAVAFDLVFYEKSECSQAVVIFKGRTYEVYDKNGEKDVRVNKVPFDWEKIMEEEQEEFLKNFFDE